MNENIYDLNSEKKNNSRYRLSFAFQFFKQTLDPAFFLLAKVRPQRKARFDNVALVYFRKRR